MRELNVDDAIVTTELYETDGKGGLVKMSSEGKNDLKPGRIVQWGGNIAWLKEDFVIDEVLDIDPRPGASIQYRMISLKDFRYHRTEAVHMKFRTDEVRHHQYMFIEDRCVTDSELEEARSKAKAKKEAEDAERAEKERIKQENISKGKELFKKHIPAEAKAVIVAIYEVDDCDSMTDYFATHSEDYVVLGWSKHKRDLFSEMRKYADVIPETAHLKTAPDVDSNGERKTDRNKDWWKPGDEHREKHSMGHGYYLKAAHRYDTGWTVRKEVLSDWSMERIYISLAKRLVLTESNGKPGLSVTKVDGVTVTMNDDKNGVEIRFPEKPDQAILDKLKANGWRWSRFNNCWYHKQNDQNIEFANKLAGGIQ